MSPLDPFTYSSPASVRRHRHFPSRDSETDIPQTQLSQKRPLPDQSPPRPLEPYTSPSKKPKGSSDTSLQWPPNDGATRGRVLVAGGNTSALLRHRSSSPGQLSSVEAATTMLTRAEETGGHRTVKMARGAAGSASPARSSPESVNRHTIGHTSGPRSSSHATKPEGEHLLESVGLAEFLNTDDRPIFVIDVFDDANIGSRDLYPIFVNNALQTRTVLLDHVRGVSQEDNLLSELGTPFVDFRSWVLSQTTESETVHTFPFAGTLWKSSILQKRLNVITGNASPLPAPTQEDDFPPTIAAIPYNGYISSNGGNRASGYFDVTSSRTRAPFGTESSAGSDVIESTSPQTPVGSTPTPAGDMAHSELLSGSFSPGQEQMSPPSASQAEPQDIPAAMIQAATTRQADRASFDWTRLPLSPTLPAHIQFARGIDWGGTSLGAIENWASDLRAMCNLIMASPHPAAMYWGRDHVAIYNEPYILLAGQKHPELMGSRYRDAWDEIWHALEEVFENAYTNAQSTMKDDDCLFIMRNGFLEETYFSWSIIPLIGDDGNVVGLYNPAFEKTRRKVAERRMLTLREIGEKTATATQVDHFWNLLLDGLSYNELDCPMVMVYSLNSDNGDSEVASSASSSGAASKTARLEGTLGVPPHHHAAPLSIDLKSSHAGFAWTFRQALTTDRPIVLRTDDGSLDPSLIDGLTWRGYGDPSRVLVVCPIHPTTGESTLGFLVMGTNPRRPYDEDYQLFVQLLARQLATSVASVVLFEAEIKKGEKAAQLAAQDRIELNNQLVARTQEAVEAENKFTRMAELAPVGMFIGDSEGSLVLVNDAWYDISAYPRDAPILDDWFEYVLSDDQPRVKQNWDTMLKQKCSISIEFRFNSPWKDKLGNAGHKWVLASASPEKDEDGNIKRVFGSFTDISAQKFAENLQTRRMEDALELKRQQEKYIDTTSHEMRNPLSAILQSADAITGSLTEMRDANGLSATQQELLDLTIDSAQTITLCAQHQKRIVDDVLTLSKLDSAMIVVTPVDAQPVTVVRRALKMFEGELSTADISMEFKVDSTYKALDLDYVRIDPHRLSQVLINLTTNAIKFTTTQEKRIINMYLGASTERPSQEDKWGLTYIPSRIGKDRDVTAAPAWGLGDTIYLHFAVEDTGRGLDEAEKKQLFQRFSQANPRTHISYGGSGLGLFISRELVELQGGEIGVASEAGKGSTFAFYIKARRAQRPAPLSDGETSLGAHARKRGSKGKTSQHQSKLSGSSPTIPLRQTPMKETLNVLVVEDNLINQKVLAAQLRKIGCTVYVANHGQEAIDQIQKSTFWAANHADATPIDVVLMDLEMPVMDGQTCARKIRELQAEGLIRRHIPVIAVTANAREEQIMMARHSGMDDVVSKPFRIVELVPRMRENVAKFNNQPSPKG